MHYVYKYVSVCVSYAHTHMMLTHKTGFNKGYEFEYICFTNFYTSFTCVKN